LSIADALGNLAASIEEAAAASIDEDTASG
jgi:hypothetical protein